MMGMIAYMDTSAVLKRLLDEPGAEVAADVWESAKIVAASEVVYPEARAALAEAHREGRLDVRQLRATARGLERLVGEIELIRTHTGISASAGELAERHALGAPEAVHLAAMLSIDAPRVVVTTWDGGLGAAAGECGMPVVPYLAPQASG